MSLSNCRVVLIRPQNAGNVGAAARAMRNFALTDLVLVSPEVDPLDPVARQRSTHGEGILQQARTVPDLEAALADCVLAVATSARIGGPFRRQSAGTPDEIVPRLVERLSDGPAALVFGPESTGLSNAEVARCHYVLHVPADESYPALNLGQAVAICLYELRRVWLERLGALTQPCAHPVAPFADQERMFAQLRTALEEVHFLYGTNADTLMFALRHLIARAGPSPMEVDLLFGLARQLRWYAGHATKPD
jgi:tRNA/rRNA methyltransferase